MKLGELVDELDAPEDQRDYVVKIVLETDDKTLTYDVDEVRFDHVDQAVVIELS